MPKRFIISSLILLAVSVVLIRIPLFNYLGYEFSASIAILIPLLCGYSTLKIFTEYFFLYPEPRYITFRLALIDSLKVNLLLLCIPLLVATASIFFVKNCSYFEGFLFYLLIPVITCFWTVAVASFSAVAFHRSFATYFFLLTLVLLYPFYIGYTTPQIYSYNFIYGYFPGFSYDEVLTITPTLIVFRILTLAVVAFLIVVSFSFSNQPAYESFSKKIFSINKGFQSNFQRVSALILLVVIVLGYAFREQLGFETSTSKLQHTLSLQYRTQHFRMFYAPNTFSNEEIRWVALEHEFRFQQVKNALQAHFDGTIDSYIYPDAETKQQLIGAGVTNIAKPWLREIHLNKDAWQATLKHELVHVLAGEFGMPIIRAHYNIGLVEGLATAVDGNWGNRTLHEYAAALNTFQIIHTPERLIGSMGFAFQYPSLSYVMMGSFCRFLLDRYGIIRFKELYGGKSPEVVYGKSYNQLAGEWQHMLNRIIVPPQWRFHTEFFFKRPSIFAKECARTIAKLNQDGWKLLAHNQPENAINIFSASLHKSWSTESFIGLVRASYRAMRYDTVNILLKDGLGDSLHRASVMNLLLLYGDVLWQKGDVLLAQTTYNELLALDLSEQYNEVTALRIAALNDNKLSTPLLDYFIKTSDDTTSMRFLDSVQHQLQHPLVVYLKAKTLLRLKRYNDATATLEEIQTSFDAPILNAQKEQLLAEAYFYLKQFQRAKIHFLQSLNFISNKASVERVNDWIERCDWHVNNATVNMKN